LELDKREYLLAKKALRRAMGGEPGNINDLKSMKMSLKA
jgi:hypothetical protein